MLEKSSRNRVRSSRLVNGISLILPLVLLGAAAVARASGSDVSGVWIDHTGKGAVEIIPCPTKPAHLCGHVVWLKEPVDRNGRPLVDARNPDPARRGQPMCGTQIIGELSQSGGAWDKGWIYNPEDGGRFDVEVKRCSPDQIVVHGYAGIKFLGESFVWKRAAPDLPRCKSQN
jgi:uncharacterized protein (DUF2147 family)